MSRQTLTVLIATFITVIGWIGFEIYHSATETTLPPEYQAIKPIENFLDLDTLDDIEARQAYELYRPFESAQE